MAGIHTTTAAVVLAFREHQVAKGVPLSAGVEEAGMACMATPNERFVVTIIVVESARRFAGGGEEDSLHRDVARVWLDQLDDMSLQEWWAHAVVLHPTCLLFLHDRLL